MRYGWTLDRYEWTEFYQYLSRKKWQQTLLDSIYKDSVPICAGVYMICVKIPDVSLNPFQKMYNVVYVGKSTTSLRSRFLKHCKPDNEELSKAKKCFKNKFDYWFLIDDSKNVHNLEAILIQCFGPIANRRLEYIKGKILEPIRA